MWRRRTADERAILEDYARGETARLLDKMTEDERARFPIELAKMLHPDVD